jgi:hypothetical protein
LDVHKRTKKVLAPFTKTSKTADMEKGDIPMAKVQDEVEVNHPNRILLKFVLRGHQHVHCFSAEKYLFTSIFAL